jgi:hypothetical protein
LPPCPKCLGRTWPNNGPLNAPLGDISPDGRRGIEHEPGFVGLDAAIRGYPSWADQTSESATLYDEVRFPLRSRTPIPFHRPMRFGVGVLMVAELANGFTMRYSYALFLRQFTFQIKAPDPSSPTSQRRCTPTRSHSTGRTVSPSLLFPVLATNLPTSGSPTTENVWVPSMDTTVPFSVWTLTLTHVGC